MTTRAHRLEQIRREWGVGHRRDRDFEGMRDYHRSRAKDDGSLDDRTWADLDLDAVFSLVDHAQSSLGQQALYHRLRTAPRADHLEDFHALAERTTAEPALREEAQLALSALHNTRGADLWWLAQPDTVTREPWHVLFPLLAALSAMSILGLAVTRAAVIGIAAAAIVNLFVRGITARRVGAVLGAFRQLGPLLAAGEALIAFAERAPSPLTAPLCTHLPHLRRLRRIAAWVSRDQQAAAAGDLLATVFEYLNLLFLLDANALYFASRELQEHGTALRDVIATVGDIDSAIAVASYRSGVERWVAPRFATGPATFRAVRHPLLVNAVANSLVLPPGRGMLITGSNMSGKSTLLRTVGVNAVLAQTIATVLADEYSAPVFTVRSCIGRTDDLLSGRSYYVAEVEAVLALVRASRGDDPHLFIFDELFRGTNAVERIAAAEAVLRELLDRGATTSPHVVLVATHDAELVDLLHDVYAPYHFTDELSTDGLVFHYTLQEGPATTRNAIALLQLYGAPDRLVARALDRATVLDRQRRSGLSPSDSRQTPAPQAHGRSNP